MLRCCRALLSQSRCSEQGPACQSLGKGQEGLGRGLGPPLRCGCGLRLECAGAMGLHMEHFGGAVSSSSPCRRRDSLPSLPVGLFPSFPFFPFFPFLPFLSFLLFLPFPSFSSFPSLSSFSFLSFVSFLLHAEEISFLPFLLFCWTLSFLFFLSSLSFPSFSIQGGLLVIWFHRFVSCGAQ